MLIFHCDADRVIPIAEGRRLFAAAKAPKQFILVCGCNHIQTWTAPAKPRMLDQLHLWADKGSGN